MTSFPTAVYLVEDQTADKQEASGRGRCWAKVYLSRAKAVAGLSTGPRTTTAGR